MISNCELRNANCELSSVKRPKFAIRISHFATRLACAFLIAASLAISAAAAADLPTDLQQRRARFMENLGSESMLILWSAPMRVYSNDVDYEYRQDSNFYYLTAIDQPESILVLMPGNRTRKEILFVKPRDPVREHWEGQRLSPEKAVHESGISTVYLTTEFEPFLNAVLSGRPYGSGSSEQDFAPFFTALRNNKAQIAVVGPPPGASGQLPESYVFVNKLRERFSGLQMRDVTRIFRDLRLIKTDYERSLLEESARISSEAHVAGMKAARPGAYEYEVEAAIEYTFKKNGADWGYPSIVASGPNATILHYQKSSRRMENGDLLLVDAGSAYKYMTVDITRTYPINGKFTEAQKDIYDVVLRAQEEGIKAAKMGARLSDVHQRTVEVIKDGLFKLGLITDTSGNQYQTWYTHNACHWIGIDVHDVGDRNRPLADGMAFTIEPGIYIRPEILNSLPKTAENEAFARKIQPAFEKYKNIGVRIEDSFLITGGTLKRLSASVPRTTEEIEALMRSR